MMKPRKAFLASPFSLLLIFFFLLTISLSEGKASREKHRVTPHKVPLVEKDQRRTLLDTEYGEISATDIKDGHRTPPYHIQFITLEPNSVFLPVLLHADMVFYVHTGSGRLTWANEDGTSGINLREGDLCSLREGSVFYIQSNLEAERKKLRIYAMFANTDDSTYDPLIGAYSRINKLVQGFDKKIMQAALKVPEDLIEAITNKSDTPAIVHAVPEKLNTVWELEASFLKNFLGIQYNSKKVKTYNIFGNDPDFKNRHGWTLTVTKKQLKQLKRHNIGFLMVNLTMGSMLAPHWNPRATEIAVVLQGEGMIRVVCGSSNDDKTKCHNMRFKVKQGDVFVVPRFHSMAQMSFSNEPLVFMGFSTAAKKNHPQFLSGKGSVLHILDKQILATSFDVSKTTIDHLLASGDDSIIFGCSSCAEEEERIMKEEIEKEKKKEEEEEEEEEEEKEKKKEEEKKREEEEEEEEEEKERRREEEKEAEEARKREEEEARREQEERERRREEEARREREEEETRREREREEEAEREKEEREREEERESEEAEARREQERREKRREEEEARREQERRRREEEEAERERERARRKREPRRREEEEEEEQAESEEEAARRQQEERERRREEGEERGRREEGEGEEEQAEEEEGAEREEEEARREQEKRERRREKEEPGRKQDRRRRGEGGGEQERARRHQERGREEEEAEGEEEAARRQQERRERRRGDEEEEQPAERERGGRRRHKRGEKGRSREEEEAEWEQEQARRQQEERERRREREYDHKSMQRKVEGQSNWSSFEGRRVLKKKNV